jgi:general secretion pathway protein F
VTLDEFIALNDEIAALVRVGVPLERGLLAVGKELSGKSGRIAQALAERLNRGETLQQALKAEGEAFPGIYRAVVEAGLRAGRLSVALEGLARFARSYADLRRAIALALFYPLFVGMLAYALFVVFVVQLAPRFVGAFQSFRIEVARPLAYMTWLGDNLAYWGWIIPALLVIFMLWWLSTGRAALVQPSRAGGLLRRLPWMKSILDSTEAANFADLLALLLEHFVPFDEAVTLAADASGDRALREAAGGLAQATQRGESLSQCLGRQSTLPPLLRWMMASGQRQGTLVSALKHAAKTYRHRALDKAELIRVFLPTLLLVAIGASATLVFALTLFVPFSRMLSELGGP